MAPFTVRPAELKDVNAIAQIHIQSWQETYTGLLPAAFLTQATNNAALERRKAGWHHTLSQQTEDVWVTEQAGEVVAFASLGPARDHPGYAYELMTLYSLQRVQGQGIGRALLQAAMNQVKAKGASNLALWVLSSNPTKEWYKQRGGTEAGEKVDGDLIETRIVWDKLG